MAFNIGDMVCINSIIEDDTAMGVVVTSEMKRCQAKIAIISDVIRWTNKDYAYNLDIYDEESDTWNPSCHPISGSDYFWTESMFTRFSSGTDFFNRLSSEIDFCGEEIKECNTDITELLC